MRKLTPIKIDWREKRFLNEILEDSGYAYEVKKICRVILLYNELMDIKKIEDISGLKRRTIFYYISKYRNNKRFMVEIFKTRKKTRTSEMEKYELKIADYFKTHNISSYKEAKIAIKNITNLERSETQIRNFLKKHDFYKNAKGFYVQKQTDRVKKMYSKIPYTSYLKENEDEVIEYINKIAINNPEILLDKLAVMIKEKYPLITESDNQIRKFIMDNSYYF